MKVIPIVIAYFPDVIQLNKNINQLLVSDYVSSVIVVDNSDNNSYEKQTTDSNIIITSLLDNKGIAEAQNIGISKAINLGCDYVLLLDQDSFISSSILHELVSIHKEITGNGLKLAAVGPRIYDVFTNKEVSPIIQKDKKSNRNYDIAKQIIASGKLIQVGVFEDIGFMESELFIDGVDHEWCWRAARLGYSVAIANNAIMPHTLGDRRINILGYNFKIGASIRLYYQVRNFIHLSKRNYTPFYWKIRNLVGFLVKAILYTFLSDRNVRIRMLYKGLIDGIKGKFGRYE
ncbi:hypothetical protein VHA01S_032_00070 [Vibrio halioticoli NBRC 102217]|uniref:Glycosyltransferase 2-like domain-containing protein n=1 Tax=Vibrio halioticoli NBRC 102217 TaxID=1219072 RepID=V5FMI7_9VIBR|nr:glycosyltransferase family 2 protein [Vibrio halioticoli]GAD90057.1 hypothetical protein VHA01S_032_00070 [Vibrio halioticoli NBRC 102217]